MSVSITKLALGLGSASGVAGLGYFASSYLSSSDTNQNRSITTASTVFQIFKEQGRTLLTKGQDGDQWKARWKTYVQEGNNIWNLEDYETTKNDTNKVPSSFMERCVSGSQSEISDIEDPLYKQIVEYCSKEFKFSELLERNSKFIILKTTGEDEGAWKVSWQKYLSDGGDIWSVGGIDGARSPDSAPPTDFKLKCDVAQRGSVFWEKDPNFVNFTRWCTRLAS
ncbi:hypothetical protein HF1_11860 [Mycoplasma haemofelis str. Langford 1]|uniref:Uncharacterized protein n=1 Tax=Mycoplasma haemofelis (strain Langford 1) TaxID=941640 RepID=E8ZJ73_MYCHL|nr:hypothetical protein [Mycoplasma haemofelis]CBY93194.1 hypothetical protein HF1_11860 [Mycoplasma haemofelis str. Langford 1]